jgi:sugar phosphate permease
VTPEETREQDRLYRPWQIRILVATWLSYAGYYFCRKPFYVAKVGISNALHFNSVDMAMLGTAYLVAYSAGQFSSAYFGRRMGPKILLLAGMGISLTVSALFGVSNGFWSLMALIAVNGLAQGTGWPGCIGSLAFWFRRKQRGSVLGLWATCYQVGSILAIVWASFLLDRAGWRWSFFGGSMVLLAVWFAVLWLHPNSPEEAGLPELRDDDEAEMKPETDTGGGLGWNRDIVVTILTMGFIYFCIKFLRYALWSWLPWFLNLNFHVSEANSGYLSTIFDICGLAGVIAGGFLSDRVFRGRRAMLCFIMLMLMTVSFFFLYFMGSKDLVIFTVSIGFAGFMLFGPDSLLSGVGAIDVGSKKGALSAAGIINGMGSIGPIFSEQLVGWLYYLYKSSLLPVLIMLVAVAAASAVLAFVLWLRSRGGRANL